MLWNPLALAALNQPPEQAAAPHVRPRARRRCSASDPRRRRRSRCRRRPLHLMYAEPARDYIDARGGEVRTGATATVHVGRRSRRSASRPAASAGSSMRVISAVPWFALAGSVRRRPAAACGHRRSGRPHGVVADRDGEPVVRSAASSTSRSSGCPAARCSGCSTSGAVFGDGASHLSLVSSGASSARRSDQRRAHRAGAVGAARGAAGDAIGAPPPRDASSASRTRRFRSHPDSPRGPATETPVRGLPSRRRLDRDRSCPRRSSRPSAQDIGRPTCASGNWVIW